MVSEHLLDLSGNMDCKAGIIMQTLMEALLIQKQFLDYKATLSIGSDLTFAFSQCLSPSVEVPTDSLSRPVAHKPIDSLGKVCLLKCSAEKLTEACILPPLNKTLLLSHHLILFELTLKYSSGCLHLAQLNLLNERRQQLVEIMAMRLLKNLLKRANCVFKFVILEGFRLHLVDSSQNFCKTQLQVV